MKIIDLTGKTFGRLTVISRNGSKNKSANWMCRCECGNVLSVNGCHLRSGHTKSCGCYSKEMSRQRARDENTKSPVKAGKNVFDLNGEYGICYFRNGGHFIFDIEDYDKIKNYCWYNNNHGYAVAHELGSKSQLFSHRLICDCPKNMVVDHINHNTLDNRKSNLRICTQSDNMKNMRRSKANKSGVKGVYFDKSANRWRAEIKVNGKKTYIGVFTNIKDAKHAREQAEKRYFLDFACIETD